MLIRVNKATGAKKPVKYAALSSGLTSGVWSDEENAPAKRPNRILLTRENTKSSKDNYDA